MAAYRECLHLLLMTILLRYAPYTSSLVVLVLAEALPCLTTISFADITLLACLTTYTTNQQSDWQQLLIGLHPIANTVAVKGYLAWLQPRQAGRKVIITGNEWHHMHLAYA